MSLQHHLAQLRHAYTHLVSGQVKDQKQLAEGLISPAIQAFERVVELPDDIEPGEIDFLRYFYAAAGEEFGPADSDVYHYIHEAYDGTMPDSYRRDA